MIINTNRHKKMFKSIAMVVVCLFLVNNIVWAQGGMNLSPRLSLTEDKFKAKYLTGSLLLSHKAVNKYIQTQIPAKGIFDMEFRTDHVPLSDGPLDRMIIIVAIPDLLKNTGQFAHVGLGRRNEMPVIYVDKKYFYNEDVIQHDKDEIRQYEGKRLKLGLSYGDFREWLINNPEGKKLAKSFHKASSSLDGVASGRKGDDTSNIYAAYLEYGLDEDDGDVNISAKHASSDDDIKKMHEIIKRYLLDETIGSINYDNVVRREKGGDYFSAYLLAIACEEFTDDFPEDAIRRISAHVSKKYRLIIGEWYNEIVTALTDEALCMEIILFASAALAGSSKKDVAQILKRIKEGAENDLDLGDVNASELKDWAIEVYSYVKLKDFLGKGASHAELIAIVNGVATSCDLVIENAPTIIAYCQRLAGKDHISGKKKANLVKMYIETTAAIMTDLGYLAGSPLEIAESAFTLFYDQPLGFTTYFREEVFDLIRSHFRDCFLILPNIDPEEPILKIFEFAGEYRGKKEDFPSTLSVFLFREYGMHRDLFNFTEDMLNKFQITPPDTKFDFIGHCTPGDNIPKLLSERLLRSEADLLAADKTVNSGDTKAAYGSLDEKGKLSRYKANKACGEEVEADKNVYFFYDMFDELYTDFEKGYSGIAINIHSLPPDQKRKISKMVKRSPLSEHFIEGSLPLDSAIFIVGSKNKEDDRLDLEDKTRKKLQEKGIPKRDLENGVASRMNQVIFIDNDLDLNEALNLLKTTTTGRFLLAASYSQSAAMSSGRISKNIPIEEIEFVVNETKQPIDGDSLGEEIKKISSIAKVLEDGSLDNRLNALAGRLGTELQRLKNTIREARDDIAVNGKPLIGFSEIIWTEDEYALGIGTKDYLAYSSDFLEKLKDNTIVRAEYIFHEALCYRLQSLNLKEEAHQVAREIQRMLFPKQTSVAHSENDSHPGLTNELTFEIRQFVKHCVDKMSEEGEPLTDDWKRVEWLIKPDMSEEDTNLLKERLNRCLRHIDEKGAVGLELRHFLIPDFISSPEDLDLDRKLSVVSHLLVAIESTVNPALEVPMVSFFAFEKMKNYCLLLNDKDLLEKDIISYHAKFRGDIFPSDEALSGASIDYVNSKKFIEFLSGGNAELIRMYTEALDNFLNTDNSPEHVRRFFNRIKTLCNLRDLNAPSQIIRHNLESIFFNKEDNFVEHVELNETTRRTILDTYRKYIDLLPEDVYIKSLDEEVNLRQWAEDIILSTEDSVTLSAWLEYLAELSSHPSNNFKIFITLLSFSSEDRKKVIADKIVSVNSKEWNEINKIMERMPIEQLRQIVGMYLDGSPDWDPLLVECCEFKPDKRLALSKEIIKRINSGDAPEKSFKQIFEHYSFLILVHTRKVGLITNDKTAFKIYKAGIIDEDVRPLSAFDDFISECKNTSIEGEIELELYEESRGSEDFEFDANDDVAASDAGRREARKELLNFFMYNPSPGLLKNILLFWNSEFSSEMHKAFTSPVKLITDRELNSLNWIVNNIPKGGNTRDERRRMHRLVIELVSSRINGKSTDLSIADFLSDAITYMNTRLTDKKEKRETAVAFVEFANVYINLPTRLRAYEVREMHEFLKSLIEEANKAEGKKHRLALKAEHYIKLKKYMIDLLMENMFRNVTALSEGDIDLIKKSISEHHGAWFKDNLIISLARYHGFQSEPGKAAVEKYLLVLAKADIQGDRFTNLPRYSWDNPEEQWLSSWLGDSLIKKLQDGYKKSITIAGGREGLKDRYMDIWSDILVHLGVQGLSQDEMEDYMKEEFAKRDKGGDFQKFWEIFTQIREKLEQGEEVSSSLINEWTSDLRKIKIERIFSYGSEFYINLDQILVVQKQGSDSSTKAEFIITEDPVEFIRSAENPYYTCQRIIEPTGFNKKGEPINRARKGQFILVQMKVDGQTSIRSILEIASDAITDKKVLLVERFYSSGLIPSKTFREEILKWAISTQEIDYVVFSGFSAPSENAMHISLEVLPSDGEVYRDTQWGDNPVAMDISKAGNKTSTDLSLMERTSASTDISSSRSFWHGSDEEKGSPSSLLWTIRGNSYLMYKVRAKDGISVNELAEYRDFDKRTVRKEFEILKKLGILVEAKGKKDHYTFSNLLVNGPDINYTKTIINAIRDIKYQVGKRGDERPLNRYEIPKDKLDVVRELVKMTVINQINIMQEPAIAEGKVLWHILEEDLISASQQNSFRQKINSASMKSSFPERIYILKPGETIQDVIAHLKKITPNATFDVALTDAKHIDNVPQVDGKDLKMLVFEGLAVDFVHIEAIIAALRALHLPEEDAIQTLLRLHNVITGEVYKGEVPVDLLNNPKEFAKNFIMYLPPVSSLPVDDIPKMNDMLLKVLLAA